MQHFETMVDTNWVMARAIMAIGHGQVVFAGILLTLCQNEIPFIQRIRFISFSFFRRKFDSRVEFNRAVRTNENKY